ncbi:hypothetical protein CDD83_4111 [Cordyceps sp. RAO-2017]|nr:hypothetical protein CDD83_4111 [Cordyceps sp. RAO-2017]
MPEDTQYPSRGSGESVRPNEWKRKNELGQMSAVKKALKDDMNLDVLWNEEGLVEARPKAGCVTHEPSRTQIRSHIINSQFTTSPRCMPLRLRVG